jgi:tetratricopeptide (TPR) repeat protein
MPELPPYYRRWSSLPPLMHGSESLESAAVLGELPGAAGLICWQLLRDVMLWAKTPPDDRPELFTSDSDLSVHLDCVAELDPEIVEPLRVIASVGRPGTPPHPSPVAEACARVRDRLEERGYTESALGYGYAAATVELTNGHAAYRVGQIARRRADYARAETWFREAIVRGRRGEQWEAYALGMAGLGKVNQQRGNLPAAERYLRRYLAAAVSHKLRRLAAEAMHDLMLLAMERGAEEEVEAWAQKAVRGYRNRHPSLPRLAHDMALHWLSRGDFTSAMQVFRCLKTSFTAPAEQLLVLGNLARAAGGAGDRNEFQLAAEEGERLAVTAGQHEFAPGAFLGFARGALSLGLWDDAEAYGRRALAIARARREGKREFEAEELLDSLAAERTRKEARQPPADFAPIAFARELAERLSAVS